MDVCGARSGRTGRRRSLHVGPCSAAADAMTGTNAKLTNVDCGKAALSLSFFKIQLASPGRCASYNLLFSKGSGSLAGPGRFDYLGREETLVSLLGGSRTSSCWRGDYGPQKTLQRYWQIRSTYKAERGRNHGLLEKAAQQYEECMKLADLSDYPETSEVRQPRYSWDNPIGLVVTERSHANLV